MNSRVLLGDEAVALGAIHAGLTAAYSYPGTPATEILEAIETFAHRDGHPRASWCANEKTAYEAALGMSFAGRRTLVSMKHVGLNVAADPFINSAIVSINGGLVLAVADDPGMHSSQNEQDSRFYADFARVICFEAGSQQEAYDMTRDAFDTSEHFRIPVVIRLVTRLAHSRAVVRLGRIREQNPPAKPEDPASWVLLPSNARRGWRALLDRQPAMVEWSEGSGWNVFRPGTANDGRVILTAGLAANYLVENLDDLPSLPAHLHIGTYPLPVEMIRKALSGARQVLVLEDGYPFIERLLKGVLAQDLEIHGRLSGHLPEDGELNPDLVRQTLGLPVRAGVTLEGLELPNRPPQLCGGCPHHDSFVMLKEAFSGFYTAGVVTSDIGCYTLGALPPYSAIESCVCMGASIGMARGAAEAGLRPVTAVIGDSTFLHSGLPALLDAIAADADMTLLILDNEATAMTGGQPPLVPTSRIAEIVRGFGVDPDHLHVLRAHPTQTAANRKVLSLEMEHSGLSVMILVRECVETLKRKKKEAKRSAATVAAVPRKEVVS
jgi:indolepyruvate ferredoxin oxidoreductase alpha subunit